jgi:hypothetical protein
MPQYALSHQLQLAYGGPWTHETYANPDYSAKAKIVKSMERAQELHRSLLSAREIRDVEVSGRAVCCGPVDCASQ